MLPLRYLCDCIKKQELMLALRWASIQYSSQFSYFTMRDLLSRLSTILKIGNRENIVTFEDMFSVTFACLEAKKVKSWKIKKKIGPQLGNIYRECVCLYKKNEMEGTEDSHFCFPKNNNDRVFYFCFINYDCMVELRSLKKRSICSWKKWFQGVLD